MGIGRGWLVAGSMFSPAETAGSAAYSKGAKQDSTLSMKKISNQIGSRKTGKLTCSGSGTNPVRSISHVSRGFHSSEDEVDSLPLPLPFTVALTPHPVPTLPQSSTFIFCMLRSVQSTISGVERSSRAKVGLIEGLWMGEIKFGTDGYLGVHSEPDREGNGCDSDTVDPWDVFGEANMGATWRPAGGRFVGVGPLETAEGRDVERELLTDGPFRWMDCGGIEGDCLTGEVEGGWGERLAGGICKSSAGVPGTDTVMNVSTSRELTTVSSPVCERSEKTRETVEVEVVVVAVDPTMASLRRMLLEDPIEDGCGTCLDL